MICLDEIIVGIADMKIVKGSGILATYALGSCVGICIYDEEASIGGMLHAMLPDSALAHPLTNLQKYVDTGVMELCKLLCRMGASKQRLRAKLAGGAKMFEYKTSMADVDIGTANVIQARRFLEKLGIPIVAEATGGEVGRTIRFDLEQWEVVVHSTDGKVKKYKVQR